MNLLLLLRDLWLPSWLEHVLTMKLITNMARYVQSRRWLPATLSAKAIITATLFSTAKVTQDAQLILNQVKSLVPAPLKGHPNACFFEKIASLV